MAFNRVKSHLYIGDEFGTITIWDLKPMLDKIKFQDEEKKKKKPDQIRKKNFFPTQNEKEDKDVKILKNFPIFFRTNFSQKIPCPSKSDKKLFSFLLTLITLGTLILSKTSSFLFIFITLYTLILSININ